MRVTLLVLFIFVVFIAGCTDDPSTPIDSSNATIIIDLTPDDVNAPWTLTGPSDFLATGSGEFVSENLFGGTYSIEWGGVNGWVKPNPQASSLVLPAGESRTFTGVFTDIPRPWPSTTPDILMDNFKNAYENMAYEGFGGLFDLDFRMDIFQGTFDAWFESDTPLTNLYFNYDDQIQIHNNLFSGLNGVNEVGIILPPASAISVDVMHRDNPWVPVEETEEYFGGRNAYQAEYILKIYFENPGNHRFVVDQRVLFFVTQGNNQMWSLLGIKPISFNLKNKLASEEISLDMFLSFYRL